ncbi:MAG: SDR family oxidoreductase [Gammaproteobacteria bacterium]|jgi:3-hydroxy acid dehydrogenase / malonic semialdehyde reductase|nr:SDR family oxidoreductase [Gammaproteobacteria bacterium]MBT5203481.1 SDR family oxidoreductase [Gammaproteobacteria bacterium]MBT5601256.1 SDR family oxidoreductase [Gammaproteobacteria bacterium]MBT6245685.1 SDR family oxidoreductase [Gammaproteobacteria bacterium]
MESGTDKAMSKRVLVTGASSGIGEATARALRAQGMMVYAAARRVDRLHKLAEETGCIPVELDVRDRQAVKALGEKHEFDILINNAGLGRALGAVWDAEIEDIEMTVDTNVTSAILMIKAVLPGMIERGQGHIVNMSSVTALYPLAAALYGATKGAIHKLSRDLRMELQGTGIRVTEINPGRVISEFYDVAIDDDEQRKKTVDNQCEDLVAEDIADAIVYCVTAPWRVNVSQMEILPTEQTYGGSQFVPMVEKPK